MLQFFDATDEHLLPAWVDGSILRWIRVGDVASDTHNYAWVIIDGKQHAVVQSPDAWAPMREGAHHVDLVPQAGPEQGVGSVYYVPAHGSRAKITWSAVDLETSPDFVAYRLYYTSGGGDPDTLYAEYAGAASTEAIVGPLATGTYKFAVTCVDALGNESAQGPVATVAIGALPVAPSSPVAYYDSPSGTAIISWTSTDALWYAVYCSHLPGYGRQEHLVLDRDHRLAFVQAVGAGAPMLYQTNVLEAGQWLFCVRAVSDDGRESDYTILRLATSGAAAPFAPSLVYAVPAPGGAITCVIRVIDATDIATVRVYADGVQCGSAAATAAGDYTITTSALATGDYSITAKTATSGGVLSIASNAIRCTADATAPDPVSTTTGEVIV